MHEEMESNLCIYLQKFSGTYINEYQPTVDLGLALLMLKLCR